MYTQADFVERFRALEDYELLDKLATSELTEEARAALRAVLHERGVPETQLPALLVQAKKDRYRRSGVTNDCDRCGKSCGASAVGNGAQTFCSTACRRLTELMEAAAEFDDDDVHRHALVLQRGACPGCLRQGTPIEVRRSYHVWSAIFLTRWGTSQKVRCRRCGIRNNLTDAAFSATLGWWGFPFGLLMTPVQILRNLGEMLISDRPRPPSRELLELARLDLGQQVLQGQGVGGAFRPGAALDDAALALPDSSR
ncbi:hypothetical protein [Lysobacter silvisoli]|uniref:Uncharacterized protein n=1 Tax=Lysobacter silvisoli TaxID=2293254 RepID=A0A371K468_9GAMM|nr:hypothetical protein [Lysobacter silvisoli]RDZ28726.1 hypothetical protein DX914_06275 [Lysobacter silvisoli]